MNLPMISFCPSILIILQEGSVWTGTELPSVEFWKEAAKLLGTGW